MTAWTAAIGTANSTVTNVTTSTTTTRNYQTVIGAESSLVSYYKLDETSGTSIVDSKNSAYNGTIGSASLNQPSLISGLGSSIKFSGSSAQQITIPAGSNAMNGLGASGGFSVELWYRRDLFDAVPQTQAIFDCLGTNTGFKLYVQYYAPTSASRTWGLVAQFGTTGGYFFPTIFGGGGIPDASFFQANHVVVTYDGSNVNAYVNGRQTLSSYAFSGGYSYAPATSTTSLKIGGSLPGAIDEVAIYNTALTADQVRNHYYAAGDFASTGDFPRRAIAPTRTVNQTNIVTDDRINRFRDPRGTSTANWSGYAGAGVKTFTSVADGPTGYSTAISLAATPDASFPAILLGQYEIGTATTTQANLALYAIPVNPGGKLSASVWVKPSSSTGSSRIRIYWRRGDGVFTTAQDGTLVAAYANTWQQLSDTFTVPAGAEWAYAHVYWDCGSGTAVELRATGWIAVPEATIPTFFDGSSTGARWFGTANNSFSSITNSTRSTPKIRSVTGSNAANATDELLNKLVNPSVEFGATITNASSDGTNYTYTANNAFSSGMSVTVLNVQPSGYQITGLVLSTGLSSTSFKIANTGSPGTFTQGGIAMANASYSPNLNSGTNTTVVTTPSTDAYAGSYSTNVAATATSSTNQLVLNGTTDISGSPFNGNRNIFVSAAIKLASVTSGTTMNFQIAARCYLNSNISSNIAPVASIDILTTNKIINISDGWVIVSGVVKTAPGTERLGIRFYSSLNGAAAGSTYIYRIDQIAAVLLGDSPASTISSYFDGSYPNARWIGNQTINAYSGLSMVNMSGSYNRNISPSDPIKANDTPSINQKLNRFFADTYYPINPSPAIIDRATRSLAFNKIIVLKDFAILVDSAVKSYGQNRRTEDLITITDSIATQWFAYLKSFGYIFENQNHIRTMFPSQDLGIVPVPNTETEFYITTPQLGIADFSSNDY